MDGGTHPICKLCFEGIEKINIYDIIKSDNNTIIDMDF